MELKLFLAMLRRWAWLIVVGVVVGALGGFFGSFLMTPVYEASTKVMVTRSQQEQNSDFAYLNSQQFVLTYVQLLTTPQILETVSQQINNAYTPDELLKILDIQQVRDTQVIEIKVQDTNPARAMTIANLLVQTLIDENESLQAGHYQLAKKSIETQIQQVDQEISQLRDDYSKLSGANLQQQIARAQEQITAQQKEAASIQQDIASLSYQPVTADTTAQINDKRIRLSQVQAVLASYQDLYSSLQVLGHASTTSTDGGDPQLSQIQATLSMYQQLYTNLLTSREQINLASLQNTPNVNQIVPAGQPIDPVRPKPALYTVLAAVLGLIIVLVIVFIIEYFDDTIKTPQDVERVLGVPVLGYITEISEIQSTNGNVYVGDKPRSPTAEAFRSLRTNIEFAALTNPLHTIMITSAGSGEGKSTVASNLASIFSQTGSKVTLLDADLRRPMLHTYFNLPNRLGLTDVFRGRYDLHYVTQPGGGDNPVSIITTGSLPPNPTELLASDTMDEVIQLLKDTTDLVVIDSAPAIVADAQVLAAKVDGVLLVICPGRTHEDAIKATMEQLVRAGAHVIGVVFNRIPQNRASYYGGYKYLSSYRYSRYKYLSDHSGPTSTAGLKNK